MICWQTIIDLLNIPWYSKWKMKSMRRDWRRWRIYPSTGYTVLNEIVLIGSVRPTTVNTICTNRNGFEPIASKYPVRTMLQHRKSYTDFAYGRMVNVSYNRTNKFLCLSDDKCARHVRLTVCTVCLYIFAHLSENQYKTTRQHCIFQRRYIPCFRIFYFI